MLALPLLTLCPRHHAHHPRQQAYRPRHLLPVPSPSPATDLAITATALFIGRTASHARTPTLIHS